MKFFKKSDAFIIFGIILFAVIIWLFYNKVMPQSQGIAEIYYGSELVKTVPLDQKIEESFSLPQEEHVIFHLSKEGTIAFEFSDCSDQICVRSGELSKVGEMAACLPNKLILKIVPVDGNNNDNMDVIIG
ncbi:MAG: NusG domain II-containing protein [Eubacteriaceae bacterium]